MKKATLILLISLTLNCFGADVPKVTEAPSFYKKFEFRSYASAFADNGDMNFKSGAVGIETIFNLNKNVGFSADLLGKDDTSGPLIDRTGVNLITSLPLSKAATLYAEGGFGYWTDGNTFDMVVRGGIKFNITKNFNAFADIGQGFRFEESGSYQQVRGGLGFKF